MGHKPTRGSSEIHVLGVDPSLASMGIAVLKLEKVGVEICKLDVLRTAPNPNKARAFAADDIARRGSDLCTALQQLCWQFHVGNNKVVAIATESMSWPRNASAAAKLAVSWGLVVALAAQWDVPLFQVRPIELKEDVVGKKNASKEEVEMALRAIYPDEPFDELVGGIIPSQREHAWDALAAATTCLRADGIRMLRALL